MTDTNVENEDKKQINEEELEKKLNAENIIREDLKEKIDDFDKEKEFEKEKESECEKTDKEEDGVVKTGEVEKMKKQLEESQKESHGRIRVPIGGIKIPGFLRSRSRDKNKEADVTAEEGADLLETNEPKQEEPTGFRATLARQIGTLTAKNPFAKKEPVEGEEAKPTLLKRIKLPAVAVLPKKFTRGGKKNADLEQGAAELASVETFEDGKPASPDDGMESVRLDGDETKDAEKSNLTPQPNGESVIDMLRRRITNLTKQEKAMIIVGLVILLFLIIFIITLLPNAPVPTSAPVVDGKVVATTQCGPVEGTEVDKIFVFRGIPYAVPPTENNRWLPAKPLNNLNLCWNESLFIANNDSRHCWQQVTSNSNDGFEDCLTLNIYTPEVRYINPMPVVVLLETDSLLGGITHVLEPTGEVILSQEVVFVKPNFRLGVLGFLAGEALFNDVYPHTSGNYGLSDIVLALKWVQLNIEHFGGDPKRVTLLGHRGGATLATALTVSPPARNLFVGAWAASGSALYPGESDKNTEDANNNYITSQCEGKETSDAVMKCLRQLSAETLLESIDETWRTGVQDIPDRDEDQRPKHDWLVVDRKFILKHVWDETSDRHATLVVGTTAQSEASAALWEKLQRMPDEREQAIRKHIEDSLLGQKNLSADVLTAYNATWEGLVSIVSDIRTVCPLLAMTRSQTNVTFYVATLPRNHTNLGSIADGSMDMSALMGTYRPNTPVQQSFVQRMQSIFYKFVTSGEVPTAPERSKHVLIVGRESEWTNDYPNCNFWIKHEIVPKNARRD